MKYLILLLFSFPIFALEIDQSVICSGDNYHLYKGIKCCLNDVSLDQCQQIIDNRLPARVVEQVQTVRQAIDNKEFTPGYYPNCNYAAVEYNFPNLVELGSLYDDVADEYTSILESFFTPSQESALEQGDLVVYYMSAKERFYVLSDDIFQLPKVVFKDVEGLAHTAIYLFDDLVFQAESSRTKTYSIASIETVRRKMINVLKGGSLSFIKMKLKYYKPKK